MPTMSDFLAKGYFPKELPPSFTTVSFATAVDDQINLFGNEPRSARLCTHNLARAGTLPRKLGIPNPVLYYQLVRVMLAHWQELMRHIAKSRYSCSKPTTRPPLIRAIVPEDRYKRMENERLRLRARAPLVVQADLANFYGSIYTHSIPWALHSKEEAKADHTDTLYGNLLDSCVRNMQDRQTVGIPVGPDTSLVISEIILSAVDEKLYSTRDNAACRQADDYEIRADDRADAERIVAELQRLVGHYELELNPRKTTIIELPCEFDNRWVHEIRGFRFRERPSDQKYDLLAFFDLCFREAREFSDQSVLKYALSRLRRVWIHRSNWSSHERFLHQAMLAEPGVIPEAVSQLIRFERHEMELDKPGLAEVLNRQIVLHAPQRHVSEIAWAIWTAIAFELDLTDRSQDAILELDDSVVGLLALDAESQGVFTRSLPRCRWREYMTTDALYGEQWLLSYEARLKEWRESYGTRDHIADDPHFEWMRKHSVTFYSPVARPVDPPVGKVAALMEEENLGFSAF